MMTCRVSSLNSKCSDNAYEMAPRKPKKRKFFKIKFFIQKSTYVLFQPCEHARNPYAMVFL